MKQYDVVVIGSGPGGEGAAMTAAKNGKEVAIVDRESELGGGCVHWGTIPSKVLRHAIQRYDDFRSAPMFQPALRYLDIEYPDLLREAKDVVSQQVKMRRGFYERNDVRMVDGLARFVDEHTLEVTSSEGITERIKGKHFIVAVGTSPWRPEDIDFGHPRVLDSNSVLQLEETPGSITIYGAGVIGCEYASILRSLGCKLDLVNTRDKLLSFLDDEIIDALSYHLRDQGTIIRHNEEYEAVEARDDGVILHLKSGKKVRSDYLLWAQGRTGNTQELELENVGCQTNSRKQLDVNEYYQTCVEHIYAVGDVVGFPGLASASYDQGRFAAAHIVRGEHDRRLVEHIPTGIYTSPEISSVGPTERELTEQQVPYEVGHALFRSLARAQIVNCRVGMLKILFHRETFEILGIHCFGYQAAEILHIGQAIMSQPGEANDLRYFTDTTFNYPTMAEAYRVAALNGINRVHGR
ncbi:MAG: Si-specific NAD(P)(+) transhydrogenase [Persicimonas sp.]